MSRYPLKPRRQMNRANYMRDWNVRSREARREYGLYVVKHIGGARPKFSDKPMTAEEDLEYRQSMARYEIKQFYCGLAHLRARRMNPPLEKDQLRGLPLVRMNEWDCGVYFLWYGPELVYIGKSNQIATRVWNHANKPPYKQFTHATWMPVIDDLARHIEAGLVLKHCPPLNMTLTG